MALRTHRQEVIEQAKGSPPLQNGDRLTAAEFHRRYRQHPEIKKAELVEGVVYMGSPVHTSHSRPHSRIVFWAGAYLAGTPGIDMADNQSVRLDNENEVQPDLCLWRLQSAGGEIEEADGLLVGAPDLVVEVAASSASYDLHQKLRVYQRSGVCEYLVLLVHEAETRWYHLDEGAFHLLAAEEAGILRSRIFPGLWLHPSHLWGGDLAALQALVQQGLQSPEHAEFIKSMQS